MTLEIYISWWICPNTGCLSHFKQRSSRRLREVILLITSYINIEHPLSAWMGRWWWSLKWIRISGTLCLFIVYKLFIYVQLGYSYSSLPCRDVFLLLLSVQPVDLFTEVIKKWHSLHLARAHLDARNNGNTANVSKSLFKLAIERVFHSLSTYHGANVDYTMQGLSERLNWVVAFIYNYVCIWT